MCDLESVANRLIYARDTLFRSASGELSAPLRFGGCSVEMSRTCFRIWNSTQEDTASVGRRALWAYGLWKEGDISSTGSRMTQEVQPGFMSLHPPRFGGSPGFGVRGRVENHEALWLVAEWFSLQIFAVELGDELGRRCCNFISNRTN